MNDFAVLKREAVSIQAISSVTGFDRKTVRKYLLEPDAIPGYGPRRSAARLYARHRPRAVAQNQTSTFLVGVSAQREYLPSFGAAGIECRDRL